MHYIDTLNKCQTAKEFYLTGVSQKDIAAHFNVGYITIWRWLTIAGITEKDKQMHRIKQLEREVK